MSQDRIVCFERYRLERERRLARLADVPPPQPLRSPFPAAAQPSERDAAHRARMLAHLQAQRRAAL